MVIATALGVGLIFLIAVIVGIVDALQAPSWRLVAAERRQSWEARALRGIGTDAAEQTEAAAAVNA